MPHALLVDDDEPFLEALAEAVSRQRFSTTTATSLEAAKAALAAGAPDIALIDLHLPDGSGMELLDELSAFPNTEIVLITGRASVETAVAALRRGASDYLVKPVELDRIKSVLANVSHTRELKALAASLPWARRKLSADALPVFGRYEVDAEIGDGAMGRVYRCRDPLVGRLVAVKTVKSEYLSAETRSDYFYRFRREAQAAGILSHPGIVAIYDVGDDHIVMEYVEGATLQDLLRQERALEFSSAVRVLTPLAEALDYAHEAGVIHRDIKPSNIMVQPDGRPKLMDFGVARMDAGTVTRTGHVLGSPSYMAPEQILGEPLSPRADLFSFAVVAYEALTGRRPFHGDSVPSIVYRVVHDAAPAPSSINRELPVAVDAVFAQALAKDPQQRYSSAIVFVGALIAAQTGTDLPVISPDPLLESLLSSASPPVSEPATASEAGLVPLPETPRADSPTTTLDTLAADMRPAEVRAVTAVTVPGARRRWPHAGASLLFLATLPFLAAVPLWMVAAGRQGSTIAGASNPLRIETQPDGMPVWIDGRPAGRAPLVVPLTPGSHRVKVLERGYAPAELTLELGPGTTAAPLRFVMAPLDAVATMPLASDKTDARRLRARPGESPPLAARGSAPSPSPTPGTRPAWAPLVVPPRRIAGEMPGYPKEARRLALSGSVLLDMLVTESGQARQIRVLESAGALLDETVVEAVSSWRFEPATRGSVKVPARWRYRHTFNPR